MPGAVADRFGRFSVYKLKVNNTSEIKRINISFSAVCQVLSSATLSAWEAWDHSGPRTGQPRTGPGTIVEIPKHSGNKYVIRRRAGALRLDRTLYLPTFNNRAMTVLFRAPWPRMGEPLDVLTLVVI